MLTSPRRLRIKFDRQYKTENLYKYLNGCDRHFLQHLDFTMLGLKIALLHIKRNVVLVYPTAACFYTKVFGAVVIG